MATRKRKPSASITVILRTPLQQLLAQCMILMAQASDLIARDVLPPRDAQRLRKTIANLNAAAARCLAANDD